MTKREYHLQFCTVCQNKAFDVKQGIVCSLTSQPADFERSCPDYSEDPNAIAAAMREHLAQSTKKNLASHQARFIHRTIDAMAISAFYYLVFFRVFFFILTSGFDYFLEELHPLLLSATFYGFAFAYYFIMEGATGKTLGKMATGSKVVAENGAKPTWTAIFIRSLARLIPLEAFTFLGTEPTGLHDTLSKTRVIKAEAFNPHSHHTPLSKAIDSAQRKQSQP